ncbi:MAG: outer membrane protein assembly factor BamD [Fimbriimonadaceae bacterium]|nr:outer membrane protein assembly factor BamD [Alphaproteobacteria bacterium]
MVGVLDLIKRAGFAATWVALILTVSACSRGDDNLLIEEEVPLAPVYNEALNLLDDGKFKEAAKRFDEVDRQHPYSEWARKAMIMSAYARFRAKNYDEAIQSSQRYLALHPGSEDAAYAQFLIAQSYYEQIPDVTRDQTQTERALEAFQEVARRYPESDYARDSLAKIQQARNQIAGKEMEVGRYYLTRDNYVAALNRFKKVVTDYQTTSHIEEALMRLTETYMAMGITSEAQTAAAILGHNYPDSQWYKDAHSLLRSGGLEPREDKNSFLSRTWKIVRGG